MAGSAGGRPKAFLPALDRTFISRSIDILRAEGVSDIVIVTGYGASFFEELAGNYAGAVRTVHNPEFDTKGTMRSLLAALDLPIGPFLVLDADIVFERRAVKALLLDGSENAIMLSGIGALGDEFLAWTEVEAQTGRHLLRHLSKRRTDRDDPPTGEHMGIMTIGPALAQALRDWARRNPSDADSLPYENCLLPLFGDHEMVGLHTPDLVWTEVDTVAMLDHAQKVVLPKLALLDDF
jgi:choline kinase